MQKTIAFLCFALFLVSNCIANKSNTAMFSSITYGIDDDVIQEMGILKSVEDSGYPYATLVIEFPERKFSETFTINMEEVKNAPMASLNKWIGRYVSFGYTSDSENALLDIQVRGTSLLGTDKAMISPEAKSITGILKGAKQATPGDIPDVISIVSPNNTQSFEFFITEEMVKANNTRVTAIYEERYVNTIKNIKVLPK